MPDQRPFGDSTQGRLVVPQVCKKVSGNYLVILVQRGKVSILNESPDFLVAQPNTIVEVAEPNDRIVVVYGSIAQEAQAVSDGLVVSVPFVVICKPCR